MPYELQDIKQALQASRVGQSAAESVVAQGLKQQAIQASTRKPVRKLVSDPFNEVDSESSATDDE